MTWNRVVLLFSLAVVLFGCEGAGDEGVAAVVNGYNITYAELDRYYQSQVQDQQQPPGEDQARMLRLNLLREVIDRQVLLQKAQSMGLMAVDDEVDARLRDYRTPYDSDDELEASLAARGMSLDDLRVELRRSITIEKLFNKAISAHVKIPDSELRAYYDLNTSTFTLAEQQLHLAQILVTAQAESPVPNLLNDDAQDEEAAKAKIAAIEESLNNGDDFAVVARNRSEDPASTANGGDLGYIPQSALEKADLALRRVVAALSPGEHSPVIETNGQYRIIKLISKESAGQRDFSDPRVQQQIRDTLSNRRDQMLKAAFLEVARSDASIRNYFARRVMEEYGVTD